MSRDFDMFENNVSNRLTNRIKTYSKELKDNGELEKVVGVLYVLLIVIGLLAIITASTILAYVGIMCGALMCISFIVFEVRRVK